MVAKVEKAEGILRIVSMVLSAMTALVVGLDAETKTVFFVDKKATVKILEPLWILTIIASVAAAYQLIQICRCCAVAYLSKESCKGNKIIAWMSLLLDQGATYIMFGSTVAGTQASMVAVTGVRHLQWSKLCNIYTKFCVQVGGGIVCGLVASFAMAIVSSVSAHRLFRLYPSYPSPSSPKTRRSWILF